MLYQVVSIIQKNVIFVCYNIYKTIQQKVPNIVSQPDYVWIDFEQVAIGPVKQELTNSQTKSIISFGQNKWRRVQSIGLSIKYGEDEKFSFLVHNLLAFDFFQPDEIEIPSVFTESTISKNN